MRLHITDQVTNHTALSHPIKNLNSLTRSQGQGNSRGQNIHNNTHYMISESHLKYLERNLSLIITYTEVESQ